MITINTDKGIVRIQTWEEIQERPGFRSKVDPKQMQLKAIIGSYQFKDKVHCGLPCNQPHYRGYLVVTDRGLETNIGKDCGKTHFSVEFETMSRNFERDLMRAERREIIRLFQMRLGNVREEIRLLKEDGANWVYKQSRPLVELYRGVPSRIVTTISDLVRGGSADVYLRREATEKEYEHLELQRQVELQQKSRTLPKPQFVSERIASIAGLRFFAPELDLRRLIADDIDPMLDKIKDIKDELSSDRALGDAAKWIGEIDAKLNAIRQAIDLGRILLVHENLAPLGRLLQTHADRTEFSVYLKQLPHVSRLRAA